MASKIRTPIAEMTNFGGIGAAIKSREATLGHAQATLDAGTLRDGRNVTARKTIRLEQTIRQAKAELAALYARRDELMSATKSAPKPAPKSTAQGAPSSRLEDWE